MGQCVFYNEIAGVTLYWSFVCALSSINKLVKFEISNKNCSLQFIILTMSHKVIIEKYP